MELKTVIMPSFTQQYQHMSYMIEEQWKGYVADLEAEGKRVSGYSRNYTITFPECEHTYAPTLATVHKWIYGDWGPFHISWKVGRLCPFNPEVGRKNMTCCQGNVDRMRCVGLIVEERHVEHLQNADRLVGRVVCYEWNYLLSRAYWDLDSMEMVDTLPDDPQLVAFHIMRRVFRETRWFDWIQEQKRRQSTKRNWLRPLKRKPPISGGR